MHRRSTFVLLISGIAVALVLAAGYAWQSRGGGEAGEPNLLDAVNAKLQQQGEPTISPENDTGSGRRVDPTVEANADATSAALPPQPATLSCGPNAQRSMVVSRSLGSLRTNCALVGNDWIVTTTGYAARGVPGVIAVYVCDGNDAACLNRGEPALPGDWRLFDSPVLGGLVLRGMRGADSLFLLPGGFCFNLTTFTFDMDCSNAGTPPAATVTAVSVNTPAPETPSSSVTAIPPTGNAQDPVQEPTMTAGS